MNLLSSLEPNRNARLTVVHFKFPGRAVSTAMVLPPHNVEAIEGSIRRSQMRPPEEYRSPCGTTFAVASLS